ncbi:hypothetical protein QIW49_08240 [Francisellaceae bacterium CB300]
MPIDTPSAVIRPYFCPNFIELLIVTKKSGPGNIRQLTCSAIIVRNISIMGS